MYDCPDCEFMSPRTCIVHTCPDCGRASNDVESHDCEQGRKNLPAWMSGSGLERYVR